MSTPEGADPFGRPYARPPRGFDTIGWFIAKGDCLICAYEAGPGDERKAAVIDALMAGKPRMRPGSSGRPE